MLIALGVFWYLIIGLILVIAWKRIDKESFDDVTDYGEELYIALFTLLWCMFLLVALGWGAAILLRKLVEKF